MSQENLERFQRAFAAYNAGDIDAAVADIAPECEYVTTGTLPGARGIYRGPEGYKRFVSWLRDEFEGGRLEVNELIDAGDRVFASLTLHGRGRQSGIEASWTLWQVWTVKDDLIVHGQGFTDRAEALEAAGLSE
jgi:ketosteroid isomerase-like protein